MRHGVTPLNQQKKVNGEVDEPLASEGFAEAKAAIGLIPQSITKIYVSPLLRAQQTADIFSKALHLPMVTQEELCEVRMGSLAGKSWEEMDSGADLKKKHRSVQFDYRPFGGESVKDVKKRLFSLFKKLNGKHEDEEALLITHGGIIRMLNLFESGTIVDETQKHVSLLTFDLSKILENA